MIGLTSDYISGAADQSRAENNKSFQLNQFTAPCPGNSIVLGSVLITSNGI